MSAVVLLIVITLLSISITFWVRCYALKHLLDIPNQRSSHQQPTPRGGGLAIVSAFSIAVLILFFYKQLELRLLYTFAVSLLIAGIGFWDDHQHIAAHWRLLTHISAAFCASYLIISLSPEHYRVYLFDSSFLGYFLSVTFLVWSLNLFNFMDGIDGIAASEAVFVAAVLGGMMWFVNPDLAWLGFALAASSLGFLALNWPIAKIFMGDVGSGFLGFVLGLLILIYSLVSPVFLAIGLMLFAVFITDASYTLLVRILAGEKWYQAHCSHAYQHAAKQYGHLKVLLAVWAINLFWILPVTIVVYFNSENAVLGLTAVYLPLIVITRKFNAGRP